MNSTEFTYVHGFMPFQSYPKMPATTSKKSKIVSARIISRQERERQEARRSTDKPMSPLKSATGSPPNGPTKKAPTRRKNMPAALRQAVWKTYAGAQFEVKCHVTWCKNIITPFAFEVGHNVPVSKGGTDDMSNLRPICSNCNKSMGNMYTIDEFSELSSSAAGSDKEDQIVRRGPITSNQKSGLGNSQADSQTKTSMCTKNTKKSKEDTKDQRPWYKWMFTCMGCPVHPSNE